MQVKEIINYKRVQCGLLGLHEYLQNPGQNRLNLPGISIGTKLQSVPFSFFCLFGRNRPFYHQNVSFVLTNLSPLWLIRRAQQTEKLPRTYPHNLLKALTMDCMSHLLNHPITCHREFFPPFLWPQWQNSCTKALTPPRGEGGTPSFGLYGYVPLNRVWFSLFRVISL